MKHRPTDAEFDELKRVRDETTRKAVLEMCKENGWDPAKVAFHTSNSGPCYCACPEGPCQHIWDGPEYVEKDQGYMSSTTCSHCGAVAAYHDMRCGP